MNTITKFRLCTLTDDELLGAIDSATDQMYQTGKIPDLHIPARPDADFDLIVGELICRFIEVKNELIAYRRQLNIEPKPNDYREKPINTEWFTPGMYFDKSIGAAPSQIFDFETNAM
jgi:hypothetical protein